MGLDVERHQGPGGSMALNSDKHFIEGHCFLKHHLKHFMGLEKSSGWAAVNLYSNHFKGIVGTLGKTFS